MNNTTKSLILGCGILAAAPAYAGIETEVHAGYHSTYEFRGVDFGDDLFEAGIDFNKELMEGLTLNGGLWYGDTDGIDGISGSDFDELDLYIGVTQTMGIFDVNVGYTHYSFPGSNDFLDSDDNTDEFHIGFSTELSCGMGLSLTYYRDVNEIEAGYIEAVATKSYQINDCTGLDLAVGAAYSDGYNLDADTGSELNGFNHYFVSVAAPYDTGKGFVITPYIKYVGADNDLLNDLSSSDGNDDLFLGGVTVSYAF
ncbi:MAG: hypothetical protein ACSHX0_02320 [Akkermansiaceae bacterium]